MPIKFHTSTQRCDLGPEEEKVLDHELARLEKRTTHINPDLMHLVIHVEKQPRREEYEGSVRLFVLNRALPARRNRAPTLAALLRRAFKDVEEQLDRYKVRLRREPMHDRRMTRMAIMRPVETLALHELHAAPESEAKGFALAPAGVPPGPAGAGEEEGSDLEEAAGPPPGGDSVPLEQGSAESEALWQHALRGDRSAFLALAHPEVAGLEHLIVEELEARGQPASDRTVEGIVADVLAVAFRQLARRPPERSLGEWMGWMVRTSIRRATF
jgi:hypothetical protein